MSEKGKLTLVNLTQDFLDILMRANGAEVDLGKIGDQLGASKRRLYDVTNVLAGIGVIERCGKSKVKWIGGGGLPDEGAVLKDLMEEENEIDRMTQFVDENLAMLAESSDFKNFAWVSEEDVSKLANGEGISLFALRGPNDLSIEVPDCDEENGGVHRLVCSSQSGTVDLIPISKV